MSYWAIRGTFRWLYDPESFEYFEAVCERLASLRSAGFVITRRWPGPDRRPWRISCHTSNGCTNMVVSRRGQ
jgi:hypothetical protein